MSKLIIPYKAVFIFFVIFFTSSCFSFTQGTFYAPADRIVYDDPASYGYIYEEVTFLSVDQTKLYGWFFPAQKVENSIHQRTKAKGTVIHYHGNAQNMTAQWAFASWLSLRGYNLFVFDYRGYGRSRGLPTPTRLFNDSNSALNYIRTRKDVDATKLLIFGQSLGGNNALSVIGMGNREGVRAVAIDSTFYSYAAMVSIYSYVAKAFTNNEYSANRHIANISPIPLLLIHGTDDRVVPYKHGEALFAIAKEPKEFLTLLDEEHLSAFYEGGIKANQDVLVEFFDGSLNTLQPSK